MHALSLALAFVLAASGAAAQAAPDLPSPAPGRDLGWVAFGLGLGTPYEAAVAATANLGRSRVLQAGFHGVKELRLGGRPASVNALHVGAGLSRVSRSGRVALAAGPAVVWGSRHEGLAEETFTAGGAVLSGQFMLTPHPTFGFGLDAFVIVSRVERAGGIVLTLVVEGHK